jgi:RloB-like protein
MNTDSLVEEAIRKIAQAAKSRQRYSDVWCVFDRDSFPLANYARAFQLAENNKIKIAWANEAFELWYLLHYCYLDASISRADYQEKLREQGLEYDKADRTIYETVKPHQERAIKNAARLEKHWNDYGNTSPERKNPSTSVYKLVEYLNELADLGNVG